MFPTRHWRGALTQCPMNRDECHQMKMLVIYRYYSGLNSVWGTFCILPLVYVEMVTDLHVMVALQISEPTNPTILKISHL